MKCFPTRLIYVPRDKEEPVKLAIAIIIILFNALAEGADSDQSTSVSERWHVSQGSSIVSEEVQFSNGEARLSGTVYLPKTGDHLPAVVVLHSAMAATRDSALYRHLREGLPALGYAVLIYDRRGGGRSSGNLRTSDFETLADDAVAGQRALARIARIDPRKIGFWGLSQGGWLAVLAAGRSADAAFAISVSAPLVNAANQMEFATSNLLLLRGYSQLDVQQMLGTRRAWITYLHDPESLDAAIDALRRAESKPWFSIAYLPRPADLSDDRRSAAARRQFDSDPVIAVRRVKVPLLFLYGDSDPWVPVAQSIGLLKSLKEEQNNIEYAVIPDANHEMMPPVNETMQVDKQTIQNDQPQAREYFIFLGYWLGRRASELDRLVPH
jgi:uncharacterized protein